MRAVVSLASFHATGLSSPKPRKLASDELNLSGGSFAVASSGSGRVCAAQGAAGVSAASSSNAEKIGDVMAISREAVVEFAARGQRHQGNTAREKTRAAVRRGKIEAGGRAHRPHGGRCRARLPDAGSRRAAVLATARAVACRQPQRGTGRTACRHGLRAWTRRPRRRGMPAAERPCGPRHERSAPKPPPQQRAPSWMQPPSRAKAAKRASTRRSRGGETWGRSVGECTDHVHDHVATSRCEPLPRAEFRAATPTISCASSPCLERPPR